MVIHLISLLQMPIAKEMKRTNLHQVFQGHKAMVTICLALGNNTLAYQEMRNIMKNQHS